MDPQSKIAVFCRELGRTELLDMVRRGPGMEPVYLRARELLEQGRTGLELEAALDELDAMVRNLTGRRLYPSAVRSGYEPLPGPGVGSGAQWWTCPGGWCTGRGRVRPGQKAPACAASGQDLTAGAMPE